jgi:hypothetical protein
MKGYLLGVKIGAYLGRVLPVLYRRLAHIALLLILFALGTVFAFCQVHAGLSALDSFRATWDKAYSLITPHQTFDQFAGLLGFVAFFILSLTCFSAFWQINKRGAK